MRDDTPSFVVLGYTACALTCALFIKSIYLQYPIVPDEAEYALQAKFLQDAHFDMGLPNILFFYVYHAASWFGREHLVCSKLLNSAFFGLSLFPLYATARRFLSAKGAYLFGIATILSPVSSYSVYMMPEAMYFFVFWVVVYVTVIQVSNHIVYGAAFLGFALAALSTVKPHGLVIIGTVPFVLAGIYLQRGEEISLRRLAAAVVGCLLAFVTGRLVISYLAQGNFTISLVGKFYQGVLRPRQPTVSSLLHVIRGHLAYLVVLFWPAIVLGVWPTEAADSQTSARSSALVGLRIFCFAALGILILMVTKFTADVTGRDPTQLLCRLHGRYYDFALPTLVLLFLAQTTPGSRQPRSATFKIIVIVGALAAGALAYSSALNYCPNIIDFPDLSGIAPDILHIAFLVLGCLGSAACLAFSTRKLARVFYCAFIAIVAFAGSIEALRLQRLWMVTPSETDAAAIGVANLVPNSQIDDGLVLARTQDGRTYRALFQLYSRSEQKILDKPVLTAGDIPPGRKWALLLDHYVLDLPFYAEVRGRGFEFIELTSGGIVGTEGVKQESFPRRYDLSDKGDEMMVLWGFYSPEDWGVWTRDPTARVYFDTAVSGSVRIKIKGLAYGPNHGKLIKVKVGTVEQRVAFSSTDSEVQIIAHLDAPAFFLEFSGMTPVSPLSLGLSDDSRPLGIGLSNIEIDRID